MLTPIFIDTAYIVALINERDNLHQQAVELSHLIEGNMLVITEAVILEICNALASDYKKETVATIEQFLASAEVEVVHITPELFKQAFELYKSYKDKAWGVG